MTHDEDRDKYSEEEAEGRFKATLRGALKTPPQPSKRRRRQEPDAQRREGEAPEPEPDA